GLGSVGLARPGLDDVGLAGAGLDGRSRDRSALVEHHQAVANEQHLVGETKVPTQSGEQFWAVTGHVEDRKLPVLEGCHDLAVGFRDVRFVDARFLHVRSGITVADRPNIGLSGLSGAAYDDTVPGL